jgi:hypothetical protein
MEIFGALGSQIFSEIFKGISGQLTQNHTGFTFVSPKR